MTDELDKEIDEILDNLRITLKYAYNKEISIHDIQYFKQAIQALIDKECNKARLEAATFTMHSEDKKTWFTDSQAKEVERLVTEAKLDEWNTVLKAKITHGGSSAPFNPDGLPISTPNTEAMTRLLHQYALYRIKELSNKENK